MPPAPAQDGPTMPLKTLADEQPSMNLTSMIDVMFLLVIFFMVGTKFSDTERNMSVRVPQVTASGPMSAAPAKRVINVYQDGAITLDRQPVTLAELKTRLEAARAEYARLGVVVRGDGLGAYQNVASVLAACREAGISDLGISVRVAHEGSPPVR
jgi:biopolymer transport protein ExbD